MKTGTKNLSMEKKLSLQEIVESIVDKSPYTKKEVENFCRVLFDTIEAGLLSDKFVKVRGLGTFKLVAVSERESIDVNTGERIQISGHTKISFLPDNYLKELVNSPFSHFQTVTLNDDINLEELATISDDTVTNNTPSVNDEKSVSIDESMESEKNILPNLVVQNNKSNTDIKPNISNPPSPKNKILDERPAEDAKSTNHAEEEKSKEVLNANISHTSAFNGPFRYVIKVSKVINRPNWWRIISIFLFLFILLVLTYFAGYYKVFCPPCQNDTSIELKTIKAVCKNDIKNQITQETLDTSVNKKKDCTVKVGEQDTTFSASAPGKNGESFVANVKFTPQKKYIIKGTLEIYKIKAGDNLNAISKKIYGHKEFSTYIIEYNNINNPNNIVVGSTIKLPLLIESGSIR